MRVLVTGANGMLGRDLCEQLSISQHTPLATDIAMHEGSAITPLDITSASDVLRCFEELKPDVVIHAAAATNVDACERSPDMAYKVNALGTWCVAAACAKMNIHLIYISTDFVFDGKKTTPYTEFDTPNPINHYGASKLAGEKAVQQVCSRYHIVRTQWLNGAQGKSFASAMIEMAKTKSEWTVVVDQTGCPTFTLDLSRAVISLLESHMYGTYHIVNRGECSWYEFAGKVLEMAGIRGVTLHPIPASQWVSPTRRPAYSVLRRYVLELQGLDHMRSWEEALEEFLMQRKILANSN